MQRETAMLLKNEYVRKRIHRLVFSASDAAGVIGNPEDDVEDHDQAGHHKGADQNDVQKSQITEPGQVPRNSEVEGDEEQEVAGRHINPLAIVFEKESEPGNNQDD